MRVSFWFTEYILLFFQPRITRITKKKHKLVSSYLEECKARQLGIGMRNSYECKKFFRCIKHSASMPIKCLTLNLSVKLSPHSGCYAQNINLILNYQKKTSNRQTESLEYPSPNNSFSELYRRDR